MLAKTVLQRLVRHPQLMQPSNTTSHQLFATRQSHWMVYLHKRYDRKTGEWNYADWDDIIRGVEEPMKNGQYEVERRASQPRHVKKNVLKQRMKDNVIAKRDTKQVEDLLKYIQFMKNHPEDFPNARSSKDRKK